MQANDRLALLIPAFNAAQHLPRLLESAHRQTVAFDEIWVYDDCSTDDTTAVAEKSGARVVRGDVNRGCSHGKNVLARGTGCGWLHFHDADDLLLPHFVERARDWIVCGSADVVAFGCEERDAATNGLIGISVPDSAGLRRDPIGSTLRHKINSISGLYQRDAFLAAGGYDEDPNVLYNEDQAIHCRLARAGLRFAGDPEVCVVNLRRSQSMWTANQEKCLLAHYHVICKALKACSTREQQEAAAERLWHVAAGAASHLDWELADKAASRAMDLAGPSVAPSGPIFKALCHLSTRLALRFREGMIRILKPRLRRDYPSAFGGRALGTPSR
jgi:GT2 family glycosyltransferase